MPSPKVPDALRKIAKPGEGIRVKKRGKNRGGAPLEARRRGIDTGTIAGAMQVSPDKPLSEMQKKFVKEWASGETILAASVRAGYADGAAYAYRMVRMPNILRLYNEEKRLYEEAAGMSRKKVMDMLLDAYSDAKLINEPASMVSAAREIGKMCGYYEPVQVKHTVTVNGKVQVDRLNSMDDATLLAFIAEQMQAIATEVPALPAPGEEEEIEDVEPK